MQTNLVNGESVDVTPHKQLQCCTPLLPLTTYRRSFSAVIRVSSFLLLVEELNLNWLGMRFADDKIM